MKEIREGTLKSNQSFNKYVFNHDNGGTLSKFSVTTDDMALLNKESETHQEVDANMGAFDDSLIMKKKPHDKEMDKLTHLERSYITKRSDSMFKNVRSDKFDYEEIIKNKNKNESIKDKKSFFLTPSYFEGKNDEESK